MVTSIWTLLTKGDTLWLAESWLELETEGEALKYRGHGEIFKGLKAQV